MRSISTVAAAISVLVAAACGATQSSDINGIVGSRPEPKNLGTAYVMTGVLESAKAQAAEAPATGLWTEVVLGYELPCTDKFESFTYSLRNLEGGKTEILASAIGSTPTRSPDTMICQSISHVEKVIVLPGIVSLESLMLTNLRGESKIIPEGTSALSTSKLEIVSTAPLCPNNAKCILNGTAVVVRAHLGCLDQLGPVTYATSQTFNSGSRTAPRLAVSAINLANKQSLVAFCRKENTQDYTISLPNFYGNASNIELTVLN